MDRHRGLGPPHRGHILRLFQKENKFEILENSRVPGILQNTPKLFCNYVLVPIILHIGPCLTFYNYN
jgi:hypothetical protein